MAKYYENSTVFHYSMEQIFQGFWQRYPNPYSSHVLSEDTLERQVTREGKLYSKRLITKTNKLPKWGERFFKAKSVCIVEESLVDLKSKTLTTYTRNIGFNKIMVRKILNEFSRKFLIDTQCLQFFISKECYRESGLQERWSKNDSI